jgi:hypothetical protein
MTSRRFTREGNRRPVALACLFVFLLTGLTACDTPGRDAAPVWPNARASSGALAQDVVDALAARDVATLEALAVSESEFKRLIWPALPASQPEVGMPVEYVWADTASKSRAHLARMLAESPGGPLTVEAVSFGGQSRNYGAFRIHPEARLTVRDESGQRSERRLCGSMIETAHGWKVYSYIVD